MKVDWKHLATTKGYRSLKAAVAKCNGRSKKERYALFYRVIGVAVSNSQLTGLPVEHFLDEWEAERSCWWYGYYSNYHMHNRDLHYTHPKPIRTIRGWKRYYRTSHWYRNDSQRRREEILRISMRDKSPKKRWDMARKAKYKRFKKL